MAELVYVLCALASLCCALLLVRSYAKTRLRLALLTCLCFAGLAANNLLLLVETVLIPQSELGVLRSLVAVVAMALLVFGLVLEDA